jgi:hypothetical protein
MNDPVLMRLAERLTGGRLTAIEAVRGGGNNRLYRVVLPGRTVALKCYSGGADDSRERSTREFAGLRFLWGLGERRIPEPLELDEATGAALYSWVDGAVCGPAGENELQAMAVFARSLHAAGAAEGAHRLLNAREAVFSHAELQRQLAFRIARLRAVTGEYPQLAPLLDEIEDQALVRRVNGPAGEAVLALEARTLSPSDFGTHNALRGPAGLTFLDFEYFGWDDPVKLVADVVWHPGMALDAAARQRFFRLVADVYKVEPGFLARFERDSPLYGLRWALIVLNEFLPDIWQRRLDAGASPDAPAARARQLAKAEALLDRAQRGLVIA